VGSGAGADAPEIESHRRGTQFLHRTTERVHDLVLHGAAIKRVRVAHHAYDGWP
jgi:hypothetical protein